MTNRRRRQQYVFAGFVAAAALLNVLFFFILARPAQAEYNRMQESISSLGQQVVKNQQFYQSLQRTSTELERFDKDRRGLLMSHFHQRDEAYSEILSQLDDIVRKTGVRKTRVTFDEHFLDKYGLYAVTVTIPVDGTYASVVRFIRELEQSETFFLINAIDVQGNNAAQSGPQSGPQSGMSGAVSLSLTLETYFYK